MCTGINTIRESPDVVAQVCNSSYLGGRDWRNTVGNQNRKKVSKTPSQSKSQTWWYVPVIPAVQETAGRRAAV
jgi:hypothetical protein